MHPQILDTIKSLNPKKIAEDRKASMQPIIDYITERFEAGSPTRLNFICTHNSRRSHLSQIWAQVMAHYHNVDRVYCYSGGTEGTTIFYKILEVLEHQGFEILPLSSEPNPVIAIKYDKNTPPVIAFSKEYNHPFNPQTSYAAIMTCDHADEACPVVFGANTRFALRYEDPKLYDGTELMVAKYKERSLQIATEMGYIFSQVSKIAGIP
jgi:arsenate reductase